MCMKPDSKPLLSIIGKLNNISNIIESYVEDPIEFMTNLYNSGIELIVISEIHNSAEHHNFVKRIIPPLSKNGNLEAIYLELEHKFQSTADEYMSTGDELYINKLIEREKQLVERGYSTQGRLDYDYFEIIRIARENGVQVMLTDDDRDKDDEDEPVQDMLNRRDDHMLSLIPTKKGGLFYVGGLHAISFQRDKRLYKGDPTKVHYMKQVTDSTETDSLLYSLFKPGIMENSIILSADAPEIREALKWLVADFTGRYDSVVCHPPSNV